MAWYLRKAISVGPIRFNFSKGGVGASVGITGFRIGMRPDGSSYIHAGRHGLYLREELGKRQTLKTSDIKAVENNSPTEVFNSVSTRSLSTPERKDLLDRLNKSYKDFRLDYLIIVLSLLVFVAMWSNGNALGMGVTVTVGVIFSFLASIYESKRRTVKIAYDFEANDTSSYIKLIEAISELASCERIWAYADSKELTSLHESKINAGAANLINRMPAVVGTGTPPWVETNITIPAIKALGVAIYFMPDCILVYDNNGVGCIEHSSVDISVGQEHFIESSVVPSDSQVVGRAWKYANKHGGPDRRFKNNQEIPICLYGKLKLATSLGLLFLLQTSKECAPKEFSARYFEYLKALDVSANKGN